MKVKEIMTSPVVTVDVSTPIGDVARTLVAHRISAVPVLDGSGAVVGIVSEHDLISRSGKVAADIMSKGVISVTEETDVDDVRHLLLDRRIRRVPVVSGGKLIGIVSRADLVALIAMEWVCDVCGTQARGEHPPQSCPTCAADGTHFVHQPQPPGL
ncbi:MAG: CBS domain-containing protein [Acidothermus sp.]|nr:CBS domain-containing protein [Acidothermus sp.]MCL6538942.1 CBS domain-containing protein [Acidothermus sp.]